MDDNAVQQAATLLWRAWRDGRVLEALPDDYRPWIMDDGYAVQAALAALSKQATVGWKIAATSAAGQKHIGVDGPIAGRLLRNKVHLHPAALSLGGNRMRVAEAEFAFRLKNDLPARDTPYARDEVMANVAALHPAIEIPDSRFRDFAQAGGAQLAADNACAHLFVLGDAVTANWREVNLAEYPVTIRINGEVATSGKGGDALGDPRDALVWLANNHLQQGEGLQAGQIITTGVCGKPAAIRSGDHVVADFGRFGRVEVRLNP